MRSDASGKKRSFFQDTQAYIPFAVIGTFVLLFAVISSVYIAKTDYELAEVIYTTDTTDMKMEENAIDFASADLARCLNYAGMKALAWQGEHPVIKPEDLTYEQMDLDGFYVAAASREAEPGDTIKVSVTLPSDVFQAISCLFSEKTRTLVLKSDSGTVYQTIDYNETHSFWTSSEFEEELLIPENAEYGYAYLFLEYDGETKALNWLHVGSSPLKDITVDHFNEYLQTSYQENQHTFNNYAINIEPNVDPLQIRIDQINGTLKREISRSGADNPVYPLYYTMTVEDLNYTLVDLSANTSVNGSMNVTALITSREPLLEQLVNEYQDELDGGVASDIVLGATNVRTFIYGPWQHYMNGPLNIVTGPSLSASVNAGTLYTQKRIFDSVDPWALTYTTYYNGKVLYDDVKHDTSEYEDDKKKNLSTTYDGLSEKGTFNISIAQGINESMKDANVSMEDVSNNSKIVVSVSNFTNEVYSNWVYNDVDEWSNDDPDLLHDVTHDVYSGTIQGQVFRDGFNSAVPYGLWVGSTTYDSVSYQGGESKADKYITWTSHHPVSISHTCAISPDYIFSDVLDLDHKVSVDASSHEWYFKSVNVEHVSTNLVCEGVDVTYDYIGNDNVVDLERTDGYLSRENHTFDWKVTYNVNFKASTRWNIYYTYHWSYMTYNSATGSRNYFNGDSSGSLTNYQITDVVTIPHTETETEYISIVYHQYLPSGGYSGIDSVYDPGTSNDYRNTTVIINGVQQNDPGCSDAADKYRDQYVDLYEIEKGYSTYTDGTSLPDEKVYCDIPSWLHKNMSQEMESMFDAINEDDPTREVFLLGENLGKNPTTLIQEASLELADEMSDPAKRESFIEQYQYMNMSQFNTSSDASRAIAKNEAYDRLIHELRERNKGVEDTFEDYIETSFEEEQGHSLLDLVKNKVSTDVIFNNPAMDMASTALASEMGIIETIEVVGMPDSKYNWTENMTLVVDQYPDYLYHDPEFDLQSQYNWTDSSGRRVYPLAVRNICIFSTGIGDDIAEILQSATEPLKDAVSQSMSQSIADANSEVNSLLDDIAEDSVDLTMNGMSTDMTLIEENRTRMMTAYSSSIREQIPATIADEIANDPVLSTWISHSDTVLISESYLDSLSDEEIVSMAADNTLQNEILIMLSQKIMDDNPTLASDEMEAVLYRLEADLRIGVADGVCKGIELCQETIDECFANINSELQAKLDESSEKLTGKLADKIDQRLQRSMKMVPCGLPVIPPHWVCTVNVWEYEVIGKYKEFEIIDNDNECMFNPYFGHDAQVYVRKEERIPHPFKRNNNNGFLWIGYNAPIEFRFAGYAATIVGPGPKGVGDKTGKRDEKSEAFDQLVSEWEN
ncbi:DUF7286 family protein [Methanolobus profundi]|uniref:Uncharacterized protein n=1 Tax=Methanolobus profundi TaxID=487685 RepID=A0A1I4NNK2_9EURY|nr:hypothetical protein [Methanolobus profundi]SFM16887.1 hypothetical protein SAMN04488696_0162 [Methanolobus profundi]